MEIDGVDAARNCPRAGFWRRWIAFLIDYLVVYVPIGALAALLFSMTAGSVQMTSGIFRACTSSNQIPQELSPAPPQNANFAVLCRVQFFGLETGRVLTVGRSVREGAVTKTISQGYMIDAVGKPISGFDLSWFLLIALVAYFVVLFSLTGKSIGALAMRMTLVDRSTPSIPGAPLSKVLLRYLAMTIGLLPLLAVAAFYGIGGASIEALFIPLVIAGALGGVWAIVLAIQIATKRDPLYDALAGTAILKD